MDFEVWAPLPRSVTLLLDGVRHPMTRDDDGWWSAEEGLAGGDYGYLLDGDEQPVPDPRSRRQPLSVHELSRTVEPFEWSASWAGRDIAGAVLYELHLGTFTPGGTLDSAIARLDHLVSLGVDFVELLPVNGFNGAHNWGYDGVLWYTVDETYGGPAAYHRFVEACHSRGLAVIQDVVYNHLGPSGNHLPRFGPYLRSGESNTWGDLLDLDQPAVRDYIVDNALMWLDDYHVDALRLDAVHTLVDTSPTHILQELSERVDALSETLGRPLALVAESDLNDPKLVTRRPEGYGLQAQWNDDFHHALHVALTGEIGGYYADFEHLDALAKVLERGFFHDGTYSSFRGRKHGAPIDTERMPATRLVISAQNHDQVGNRATGDRLTEHLDDGQLAIAAVLTVLSPFTPMLFMGEEWGATTPWQFFTAHPEPELGAAVASGRIDEFARMGWDPSVVPDPQDPQTFLRSKLDWAEATAGTHATLLELYRRLISLRHELPEFGDARFATVEFDDSARWLVLHRGRITIAVNFGTSPVTLPQTGPVLLSTDDAIAVTEGGLGLPPHSAAVLG